MVPCQSGATRLSLTLAMLSALFITDLVAESICVLDSIKASLVVVCSVAAASDATATAFSPALFKGGDSDHV